MMKVKQSILFLLIAGSSFNSLFAQDSKQVGYDAITEQAVRGQLQFLASDWTEGRSTGSPGAYMAADYISSIFMIYGLEPGGDPEYRSLTRAERMAGKRPEAYRTYFQNISMIEYAPGDEQFLSLVSSTREGKSSMTFDYLTDFSVRTSDVSIDINTPIVFAGYGYRDVEKDYDDYKGLDVQGKTVLFLAGYPGHSDTASLAYKKIGRKSAWAVRREKSQTAAELGIAAIIEVTPGSDAMANWSDNIPSRYNRRAVTGESPRSSIYDKQMKLPGGKFENDPTTVSVSNRVLNEILKGTGIDLSAFEESVKSSMKPASKELKNKSLNIRTTVDSRIVQARNVIGVIPGVDTSEIIVVGGHYDHLGRNGDLIWNGADDNASGTVGVMTVAKACMATGQKPLKTIVFCAWTGEEEGLLGSEYFADHPYDNAKILLNLNYDMISRNNADDTLGNKCIMNYTEKYGILRELAERNNEAYGLGLEIEFEPSERPRGGSDHSSFSAKDIPVFYFEAGFPPEYHQPGDHISLVNFDKMVKIIKLGYLSVWELANTSW